MGAGVGVALGGGLTLGAGGEGGAESLPRRQDQAGQQDGGNSLQGHGGAVPLLSILPDGSAKPLLLSGPSV